MGCPVAVAVGLTLLCGLPVIASALPVSVPALTATQLRGRILASADESYVVVFLAAAWANFSTKDITA